MRHQHRREITPQQFAEALPQGVPLYMPRGVYDVPAQTCTADVDIVGDGNETVLRFSGEPWVADAGRISVVNCKLKGADPARASYLVDCDRMVKESPLVIFDRITTEDASPINWGEFKERGISLGTLIVRRAYIRHKAGRGLMVNGGAARWFEIEETTVDGFGRFGINVSASARDGQDRMRGGVVRNVTVRNGKATDQYNNNAVYFGGRGVDIDNLTIENWDSVKPDGTRTDCEPFYNKVVDCRAQRVSIAGIGGQAICAAKGGEPNKSGSMQGADYVWENFILDGGGASVPALWIQCFGNNRFAKWRVNGAGQMCKVQESSQGNYTLDGWTVTNTAAAASAFVICQGAGSLALQHITLPSSPAPYFFKDGIPAGMKVAIQNMPGAKLRPPEQACVIG